MKPKVILPYILFVVTGCAIIFLQFKYNGLQKELQSTQQNKLEVEQEFAEYQKVFGIDSVLLEGDYDSALRSYSETLNSSTENRMDIPLRIALAEKLLKAEEAAQLSLKKEEIHTDSVASDPAMRIPELRAFDSLNFVLEKTKVQLARLGNQLKQKSFGEYLKFKSKKGNQLHYVGQVKNGQANGYGIALLDTGSRYEGQWKNNQRQGEGTFYWADGQYYVGTYDNDKRSGYGTYYWPNGERYAGEWKDDKRSGSGKFFGADGDIVTGGRWQDDKLVDADKKVRR